MDAAGIAVGSVTLPGPGGTRREYGGVTTLAETQVRDNVVVWTLGGDSMDTSFGTNCIAVLGTDAVLLVDPLIAPAHARQIDGALKEMTDAPVRYVVLTHHHTDHALGSSYFASQEAVVIAHRACRELMAAEHPGLIAQRRAQPELRDLFADAEAVLPSITFDQGLVLHAGGIEVEVWHPGWAHTPGDAFLFLPEMSVAICGDLLFTDYHYNYEHASVTGARKGLQALAALDADTFIPGHGAVSGQDALDAQARYHDAVEATVSTGLAAGKDDAAIAEDLRARFPNYRLGIVIPDAVRTMKEYLSTARG